MLLFWYLIIGSIYAVQYTICVILSLALFMLYSTRFVLSYHWLYLCYTVHDLCYLITGSIYVVQYPFCVILSLALFMLYSTRFVLSYHWLYLCCTVHVLCYLITGSIYAVQYTFSNSLTICNCSSQRERSLLFTVCNRHRWESSHIRGTFPMTSLYSVGASPEVREGRQSSARSGIELRQVTSVDQLCVCSSKAFDWK